MPTTIFMREPKKTFRKLFHVERHWEAKSEEK
jgi:hypothetical protein